ncbi:hypothetical protein MJO29_003888 [Puccinia striiformis f. sp. tritici]|uniref:Uncharacterized protein n=1 Tax=Puccinia striiformis TaxID=27350 RepID=A0A2S4VYX8_9BASI|nr:hypothetical protein MJO29_003888 [Puccinia striiformis f. sp. tritici]POW14706.1 hypothetical protein PSHT_07339 [Puccinia striiformis]
MASIDLSPRDPKSPEDDSHHDPNEDTTNDSTCSTVTDDNRSSLHSSDSASSPCPGLPQTPPRFDTEPPSIRVGHTLSRDDQQFWPNSHDLQTPSCSTHTENLGPGLAHPSTEFTLESPSPYITNPDTSTVILQPPTHAQSQPHVLIAKPSIQQVQLGAIPLSTQWAPNQQKPNDSMRYEGLDNVHCHASNFFPAPSFIQEHRDGHEVDPFSQLSARTLALMDQPESEVTIYDCEYCEKTYQGKHARSIWRRHLSDKHKIPLSTQPRRTRWDNDANRPKTEEERRERTLESKRRWARKNRAAKKAARDGQRNSMEHAMLYSKSFPQTLQHSTPDRSQAPSPTMYTSSHGHATAGSPEYFLAGEPHSHSQPPQSNPSRSSLPIMSRGSSTPHTFSHYPSMSAHASLSLANVPYSPSFPIGQGSAPSEWSFQSANSKPSSYPFGNYSAPTDAHSTFQLSDRFNAEGNHSSYSPPSSQTRSLRQSPPTTYGTDANQQESDDRRELPDCYTSAPLNFQYHSWELGARFNVSNVPPPTYEQMVPLSYESHSKRPRLSLPYSASVPLQHFDDLQKAYGACNLEAFGDSREFQSVSAQDTSISHSEAAQLESRASGRDEEAASESSSVADQRISPSNENHNPYRLLDSPIHSNKRQLEALEGKTSRPATTANISRLSHGEEYSSVAPLERAATEPQFSLEHDVQTPLRESGLRSDGKLHFSHSPVCRMDASGLDPVDMLTSPAVSRPDANTMALYHGHYAPMSAGKRRSSETYHMALSSSCPLNGGDWNNHVLQTPSALSRFSFNNSMLSSPAGGAGTFGSPHHLLSKSLGLTLNTTGVSGEDCLGGLLTGSSTWDMVHPRT